MSEIIIMEWGIVRNYHYGVGNCLKLSLWNRELSEIIIMEWGIVLDPGATYMRIYMVVSFK